MDDSDIEENKSEMEMDKDKDETTESAASDAKEEGEEEENDEEDEDALSKIDEEGEAPMFTDEVDRDREIVRVKLPESFEMDLFPKSYKENTAKEELVLNYVENFRRQYTHLYRDRKPLLLAPYNECGVSKFVCSFLRPTKMPYTQVYNWDGAAEFVADYLIYVPLDPETETPFRLLSPSTALAFQKGTCFEFASLLCSLLIGNGYDAYVVSGYATKEICIMDETRKECPLLKKKEEAKVSVKKEEMKKYSVKPPRDLKSRFEINQERKRKEQEDKEAEKKKKMEEEKERQLDKPPIDKLFGLRVHAWVLVLSGKRQVPESFFIEPLTAAAYAVNSDQFLGIESLWNHQNYWVNMQDCSEGVTNISYDLGDSTLWEFIFPSNDKPLLTIPKAHDEDDLEEEEKDLDVEKNLDLPPTWVNEIKLSEKDFASRCPLGKKVKFFKRAKLEQFAPYLLREGLIAKLSVYKDRDYSVLLEEREYYHRRTDKLQERVTNCVTDWITDYFGPGRSHHLKEHSFHRYSAGFPKERTMMFYNHARVDGLQKRQESPTEMTEHFVGRPDFLYYRHVIFDSDLSAGPANQPGSNNRPIDCIVERYLRNPAKPANEDIKERAFHIKEDRIILTYHTENSKIASCTREFNKPPRNDDKGKAVKLLADTHSTFQVEPYKKQKKNVEVYQMLLHLMEEEQKVKESVRQSEGETRSLLNNRTTEEVTAESEISHFDTLRNVKAKEHRKDLERALLEEKYRRAESELDYLAPFLAQYGISEPSSKQEAYDLREKCLQDFKQRLIDKANLIQARFERETVELRKRQQWYQQNQIHMTQDDESDYLKFCREANFKIATLELMLNRHKQAAPQKYIELEQKLRNDHRLAGLLDQI